MDKKVDKTLNGLNNKGLDKVKSTNKADTAAWTNKECALEPSNVSIPSDYEIEKAKNWVDNGSAL